MWVTLRLKTTAEVQAYGRKVTLPVSDLAEGCCGCLLVFSTREQAVEYAEDENLVFEVEFKEVGHD